MFGFGKSQHCSLQQRVRPLTLHKPGDAEQASQQVYNDQGNPQEPDNQGSFGHEVLAAGAGYMAMRQYQKHEEANGSFTPTISWPLSNLFL